MVGLVCVLFVGIGIYCLIGRFFVDSFYRARPVYGVTDRRVIIASGGFRGSVQSIDLSSLSGLTLEERGTAVGRSHSGISRGNRMAGMAHGSKHLLAASSSGSRM
jgi:hypothetical protein